MEKSRLAELLVITETEAPLAEIAAIENLQLMKFGITDLTCGQAERPFHKHRG